MTERERDRPLELLSGTTAEGDSVRVSVLGYEFPDAPAKEEEYRDANWLLVRVEAKTRSLGSWTETAACLEAQDIRDLGDYVRALLAGGKPGGTIHPVEPFLDIAVFGPEHGSCPAVHGQDKAAG